MSKSNRTLRAIDIYSGIGGWGLGLRMAGISVVASYDHWAAANETNTRNNSHEVHTVDIRKLRLRDLPKCIDIVVGSPPCKQFSYSNRGGNGDIEDGLIDIKKFLSIVAYLKPKAWAMENVPRVADILDKELKPKGRLARFANLRMSYEVVDMAEFGLPQRRRRCIAGRFNTDLFRSYIQGPTELTLDDVVQALAAPMIEDPIYNFSVPSSALCDHIPEDPLNEEEVRINRAAKQTHPIYNSMAFPDPPHQSVRTITATCTRVSRESIVIRDPLHPERLRRLTVRERASLQGFPITFQFYSDRHRLKLRMVGNAIPPLIAYYLGHAFRGTSKSKVPPLAQAIRRFKAPATTPTYTAPEKPGSIYAWERTFRFAIPHLRLKSGVRFELRNVCEDGRIGWEVALVFGTSKSIHEFPLDVTMIEDMLFPLPEKVAATINLELTNLATFVRNADVAHMQDLWSHRGPGGIRPFMMLDHISDAGNRIRALLVPCNMIARQIVVEALRKTFKRKMEKLAGVHKLSKNAPLIVAGMLVGSVANAEFERHGMQLHPNERNGAPRLRFSGRAAGMTYG